LVADADGSENCVLGRRIATCYDRSADSGEVAVNIAASVTFYLKE
jgi:hypothetical protein